MLGRIAPLVTVAACVAALAGHVAAVDATSSGAEFPHLRAVSARDDGGVSAVVIEATEPVAYVTSQPDPLTVLVDLRNVRAGGIQAGTTSRGLAPLRGVQVEESTAADGTPLARVRVKLDRAAAHRVRASRNLIVVEVDRQDPARTTTPAASASAAAEPALALHRAEPEAAPVAVVPAPVPAGPELVVAMPAPVVAESAPVAAVAASLAARLAPVAAPAAPAPALAAQAQSSMVAEPAGDRTRPRFTGHPVSLDFQGADLRAVLRTFSEISGLNVVIDPTINGSVDVSLRDVPWDQALDIILKANKLGYFVDGTIVRIAPLAVLADEEAQRRKLTDEQALAGELRVMTRALSYAKGGDLVPILTRSALSTRGEVQVDPRTNTVIIRDLPDRLAAAEALLTALDLPQPQVEIEARIVQTTRDFARNIGVQWGVGGRVSPDLGNTTGLAFPNNGSITGRTTGGPQGPDGVPNGVNLGVANASSALGLALGSINGALNLDVALSALERSGQGRLLSTPRVSTQNNVEAEITQGVQIPIQTIANNTVTVTFKDAALTLKVTPQITASNTVIMRVNLENAAPDFSRAINDIPPIDTQRAVTTVLVADGETTVIGGIYLSREQSVQGRTPLLSRVPLLGWLFKRDEVSDESRELLIFITPRITKG